LKSNDSSFSKIGPTLVTGGAGFIGSYVVDKLMSNGLATKVLDNLSSGYISNLSEWTDNKNFHFLNKDLNDPDSLIGVFKDTKTVFHMAADPEVKTGFEHPENSYRENIENTFHLLEKIRKSNVETILFASSSTVYGEPSVFPTPENYGPLLPISPYGASKLACEALISSYCYSYGINGLIFRFANIVGSRSDHGVIPDFIKKLQKDNKKLEILGDGKQSKSYMHVNDCVDCIFFCLSKPMSRVEIFNVGTEDQIDTLYIANIVTKSMNLKNVSMEVTGGVDGGRGWKGDVTKMQLDVSKVKKLGWRQQYSSAESMELTCKEILNKSR